jgi:glucan biosynthesis protein C
VADTREEADKGKSERIHALDGLRTMMLSLVILYHCVLSYVVAPSRNWPFKDDMTTLGADLIVRFIHAFTLPTFFMMAGFFSAMLYLRRGAAEFARNRAARIALPFAVGWMILHPIVGAGFVFSRAAQTGSLSDGIAAVGASIAAGTLLFPNNTMHLWFMYDLVFFYAAILALAPIILSLPIAWREAALAAFGLVLARPWLRLPVLALITFGMLRMVGGTLFASLSFVPNWRLLLGYGMYFGIGWLLHLKREQIAGFERFAWTHVLIALGIFFILEPALRSGLLTGGSLSRFSILLWSTIAGATTVWLFFFGLTGLFLRHFNRPSPAIRYVVDAAFWIYLVHLPLAIWLPGLFSTLVVPAGIKILMVLAITYVVGFLSYDLFVRSTMVGSTLSGRRYPRVIFGAA